MPIRRAKMLLDLVRPMSIAIDPDELIVGNRSLLPRMGVIAPEGAVDWVDRELEILPTRPQDRFDITPEQIARAARGDLPLLARQDAGRHRRRAPAGGCAARRPGQGLLAQPDRPCPGPHPARRGGLAAPGHRRPARTGATAPAASVRQLRRAAAGLLRRRADRPAGGRGVHAALRRPGARRWPRTVPDAARRQRAAAHRRRSAAGWPRTRRATFGRRCRRSGSSLCCCRSNPTPAASRRAASTSTCCPTWSATWPRAG